MKTLFLHIGSPKTGTSAIQVFCAQNYRILKKMGIIYPGEKKDFFVDAIQGKISSGNGVFIARYFREPNNKKYQEAYREFCKQLKSKKRYTLLYSSEAFWNLKRKHFEQIYNLCDSHNCKIQIVLYLRSQKEMLLSSYAQAIKAKSLTVDIDNYYHNFTHVLNYEKKLQILSKVFKKKNLHILKYTTHSLVKDFLQALGINKEYKKFRIVSQKFNPTPNINELEFLRNINAEQKNDRSFSDRLLYLKTESDETVNLTLPKDLEVEMDSVFAATNKFIAKEYGVVIGESRDMSLGNNVEKHANMSPFDEIAAKMIYSLHEDVTQQRKEIGRLEKKYMYTNIILAILSILLFFMIFNEFFYA
ncbi:hypothetical protein [Candidatus Uabimicrobium sp. HlEnr_7]|uniref:hypothetical protein n=1 Tax=Candidatus Uabimicrobium helgolandensis TaxID=3095367 RepID=UPI00355711BB